MGATETPILIVGNKRDLQRGRVIPRHNVSDLVRKSWKCGYVECSAKFNWHILLLFGEALRSVGCTRCKHLHATVRFQRALRRERCALMWGASLSQHLTWFEKKPSYSCDNELGLPSSQEILSWMFNPRRNVSSVHPNCFLMPRGILRCCMSRKRATENVSTMTEASKKSALISCCWNANHMFMMGPL